MVLSYGALTKFSNVDGGEVFLFLCGDDYAYV